jgi:polyisoprenoid-binding protein YceI
MEAGMARDTWEFDPVHSSIAFSVRHMVIAKVHGRFGKWAGTLQLDEGAPAASRIEARIDAASVDTNDPQRDAHLRSADFFDVERFPDIRFTSTRIEPVGEARYRVTGDLTIRGVTRETVLDVEQTGRIRDPWGNDRTGFSAKTAIDRKDFGVSFNQVLDAGGLAVGDRVEIAVEVEALKPAPVAAG